MRSKSNKKTTTNRNIKRPTAARFTSYLRAPFQLVLFFSSPAIEGIPWWLQILHIEQEVAESDRSALDTVLETDEERLNLLQEQAWLELELAREVSVRVCRVWAIPCGVSCGITPQVNTAS